MPPSVSSPTSPPRRVRRALPARPPVALPLAARRTSERRAARRAPTPPAVPVAHLRLEVLPVRAVPGAVRAGRAEPEGAAAGVAAPVARAVRVGLAARGPAAAGGPA